MEKTKTQHTIRKTNNETHKRGKRHDEYKPGHTKVQFGKVQIAKYNSENTNRKIQADTNKSKRSIQNGKNKSESTSRGTTNWKTHIGKSSLKIVNRKYNYANTHRTITNKIRIGKIQSRKHKPESIN